jgi:apolipoprotein N-acyltransferase
VDGALPAVALLDPGACRGSIPRRVSGAARPAPARAWRCSCPARSSGLANNAGIGALIALSLLQRRFLRAAGGALAGATRARGLAAVDRGAVGGQEALRDRHPVRRLPVGRLAFSQGRLALTPLVALGGCAAADLRRRAARGALAWSVLRRSGCRSRSAPSRWPSAPPRLVPLPTDGERVRVAVVQGNVPRLGLDFNAQRAAVLSNHVAATRQLAATCAPAGRSARPGRVAGERLRHRPRSATRTPTTSSTPR